MKFKIILLIILIPLIFLYIYTTYRFYSDYSSLEEKVEKQEKLISDFYDLSLFQNVGIIFPTKQGDPMFPGHNVPVKDVVEALLNKEGLKIDYIEGRRTFDKIKLVPNK